MAYGPPPAYRAAPPTHPRAVPVLVLGILSLVLCTPLGVVAWILANGALKQIDANPGAYSGRGMVQAGKILGIIGVALIVFAFLIVIIVFAFGDVVRSVFEQTCSSTPTASNC